MTIVKHPTNPDIFVGTPEEFRIATTGDFACSPDQWIASYKGRELDLLCQTPEDALAEAERHCKQVQEDEQYTVIRSKLRPISDEDTGSIKI